MSSLNPTASSEDLTNCGICKETINEPKALPCLHTFCLLCLKEWIASEVTTTSVVCPACKKTVPLPADGVDGLPGNFFVSSFVERRDVDVTAEDKQNDIALGEDISISQSYSSTLKKKHSSTCSCRGTAGCPACRIQSKGEVTATPKFKCSIQEKSNSNTAKKRKVDYSSNDSSDDCVQVVSESYPCQHCNAAFQSKTLLKKHMEAVRLQPRSAGTQDTGTFYIPDSRTNSPLPITKRYRKSSPVRKISKTEKKITRNGPNDWHVTNKQIPSDSDPKKSDSECKRHRGRSPVSKISKKKKKVNMSQTRDGPNKWHVVEGMTNKQMQSDSEPKKLSSESNMESDSESKIESDSESKMESDSESKLERSIESKLEWDIKSELDGGSEKVESFSMVPRNTKQEHRRGPQGKRMSDFQKILEMNVKGDFVKTVEFIHDGHCAKPRVFLCTDRQAQDIKKFCCSENTILNIDPTYNLGEFLLTASSFRHPMYVNKDNGKHVLMPGPMMVHAKRDTETYLYFAHRLSLLIDNQTVNFFRTDGEKKSVNDIKRANSFSDSKHLICMRHPRQNCDCESLNAMITRWAGKVNQTLENICSTLQSFVDSKYRELMLALHGSGDCRLSKQFAHLHLTTDEWAAMNGEDRRNHLQKARLSETHMQVHVKLSIEPEESGIVGYGLHKLCDVWQKAGAILTSKGSIVAIAAKTDAHMCFSSGLPVGVINKKGTSEFVCETSKCRNFTFYDELFCEHTLAVAEHCGMLAEFISAVNDKKRSSTTNLINNLYHQQCLNTGRKGITSKQKGRNQVLASKQKNSQPVSTPQPFSVCLKSGLIRKCYGCGQQFSDKTNIPPNDLILKRFDYREWYDEEKREMRKDDKLSHTYYHMGMDCVRRKHPYTQKRDIIVYDEVIATLTEEHKEKLKKFGITF